MVLGGLKLNDRRLLALEPFVEGLIGQRHSLPEHANRHNQHNARHGDVHMPVADLVRRNLVNERGGTAHHNSTPRSQAIRRFQTVAKDAVSSMNKLTKVNGAGPFAPGPADSTVAGLTLSRRMG